MRTPKFWISIAHASLHQLCLALLLVAAVAGCAAKPDVVSIAGNVTYKDKPLTSSALTFFPANGRPIIASVLMDGSYSCELPPGEYRATIDIGRNFPPGWREGDPVPPPPVALPAKYSSRMNSPLTASVTAEPGGSQTIDFNLD